MVVVHVIKDKGHSFRNALLFCLFLYLKHLGIYAGVLLYSTYLV